MFRCASLWPCPPMSGSPYPSIKHKPILTGPRLDYVPVLPVAVLKVILL